MAIEDVFPGHTIPDENNYLGNGSQFKAPDHSLFGGRILIERKSRNGEDNSRFYKKLREIAANQGAPGFYAVGRVNLKAIIQSLPDPAAANAQMTDYILRKTMAHIHAARRKFKEYEIHVSGAEARVLIISDNTSIRSATDSDEYFLGRKMGALNPREDEVDPIDAIFFIKDPNLVLGGESSYWFKCLIKQKLPPATIEEVKGIAAALHHRIAHYQPYFQAAMSFDQSAFRATIV